MFFPLLVALTVLDVMRPQTAAWVYIITFVFISMPLAMARFWPRREGGD